MDFKSSHPSLAHERQNNTHVYWGNIESINSEKETMDVSIPHLNNEVYRNIPINQAVSVSGAGFRMMPVPKLTFALLHEASNTTERFYHIGYFVPDASKYTSNRSETKEGLLVLQRYLESGEVNAVSKGNAEMFLANDGSVLLKSGQGYYLKLDAFSDCFDGSFVDWNFQMLGVTLQAGRVKRVTGVPDNTIPQIIRDENNDPYIEYKIEVGTVYDEETGAPDPDSEPDVGSITFSSRVTDYKGQGVKLINSTENFAQFLLKLATDIKVGVDDNGNFYLVNSITESYFKFSPQYFSTGGIVTDETEIEMKIGTSLFQLNKYGEMKYTNSYNKQGNLGSSIIHAKKDGSFSSEFSTDGGATKNKISCDSSGVQVEDKNSNSLVMSSSGIKAEDLTGNKVELTPTNIVISDTKGNKINWTASGLELETGDAASWIPNTVPQCFFTQSPHGGVACGIIKLKGK